MVDNAARFIFIEDGNGAFDTGEIVRWFPTHVLVRRDKPCQTSCPSVTELYPLEQLEGTALFFRSRKELTQWLTYIDSDEARLQSEIAASGPPN